MGGGSAISRSCRPRRFTRSSGGSSTRLVPTLGAYYAGPSKVARAVASAVQDTHSATVWGNDAQRAAGASGIRQWGDGALPSTSTTRTCPKSRPTPRTTFRRRWRWLRRPGLDGKAAIFGTVIGYEIQCPTV